MPSGVSGQEGLLYSAAHSQPSHLYPLEERSTKQSVVLRQGTGFRGAR